jgi:hypothetical protein
MKKPIFIIYFSIVTILPISFSFSALYYNKLDEKIYKKYLPKEQIYPQYSLATQDVTNKDEVTIWKDSDFVPWYGIASYKIYRFMKTWGVGVYFIAIIFFIPVFVYNLLFNWKNRAILYWVIVTFELGICYFLLGCLPPP